MEQLAADFYVYVKPITGRPPDLVNYLEADFWKLYPYERNVVVEDIAGRTPPAEFVPAIQYQQREHMDRTMASTKKVLRLGRRWRRS